MNYHIITQDKFFDAYIEDIYKLHLEANNVFWVRGKKGEMPWLKTDRAVEYLPHDHSLYVDKYAPLIPMTNYLYRGTTCSSVERS